jgi:ATP-binding cassette subfamily B protein
MKRLLKYLKENKWIYGFGVLAMGFGIFMDMFNPIITGRIIDEVIVAGDKEVFKHLSMLLILITIGRAIMGYAKEMFFDFGSVRMITSLRQDIFDHIQSLSYSFFDSKNTGELMTRIKEDADKIWHATSFGVMLVLESFITLVIATILMIRISLSLSIIAFITLPILAYLAIKLERSIGETYERISEQNAEMNSTAQENIAGVRLVKAFAREKYEINKFLKKNQGYYDLNFKQAKIWSIFYPRIEFISNILPVLVIAFGGSLVIGERLTIGTLVMFSGYTQMVMWPMRNIGWLSNVIAEAIASSKRIDTVFACESDIVNNPNALREGEIKGRVEFKHVGLEINGRKVLDDVNFTVDPNKTLAIMGATGSGKSSVINLLTRFYDTSEGQVLIDGVDVKGYELRSLRSHISVVMQEVFLFSDTIEENILFGVKNTTQEDVLTKSSVSAQAHEFIERMDESYSTIIGERGIGLSGGQKQRISIARALAKDAEILVFDDSTSALDMETELRIQKEIKQLTNRTKIIVAHRISAVKEADEILVLEEGKVVERGTHHELLELQGRYHDTFMEQYEGEVAYAN